MKKLPALLLSSFSAACLFGFENLSNPVFAQHANSKGGFYNYKPGELQKPQWRQYKGEIQLVDDTPEVKDFRRPKDPGPTYQIQIPPIQNTAAPGNSITNGGNGGTGNGPGGQVIQLSPTKDNRLLAPPGTESNMNSLRNPAHSLPNATSTGIHSLMKAPQNQAKPSTLTPKSSKHELLNKANTKNAQSNASKYSEYEKLDVRSSGSINSSTKLKGELKNGGRGSLLKQSN